MTYNFYVERLLTDQELRNLSYHFLTKKRDLPIIKQEELLDELERRNFKEGVVVTDNYEGNFTCYIEIFAPDLIKFSFQQLLDLLMNLSQELKTKLLLSQNKENPSEFFLLQKDKQVKAVEVDQDKFLERIIKFK